jgi:hypothetical protein
MGARVERDGLEGDVRRRHRLVQPGELASHDLTAANQARRAAASSMIAPDRVQPARECPSTRKSGQGATSMQTG